MPNSIKDIGKYNVKETGEEIQYEYSYDSFTSFDDLVDALGEDKVLKTCQRQIKVDANNVAREKAKVANGHSTRKVLSEEEKARNKKIRAKQKEAMQNPQVQELLAKLGLNI